MFLTVTSAPECYGHLSSHARSSRTLPFNASLIYQTPRAPSLLPSLFVSYARSFSLPLSDTHSHTGCTDNPHPEGPQREKERNGSCHFSSFNWGSAAVCVTEPLRGGHQTKEKPFTLYCLLPQRAHISLLTLSPLLFYTSIIFHPFIFFALSLISISIYIL